MIAALVLPFLVSAQGKTVLTIDFDSNEPPLRSQEWAGTASFGSFSGRTGKAVSVSSTSGADAAWTMRLAVVPNSKYRLTGWIKTENVVATTGRGALFNLHWRPEKSEAVTGTTDWKEVGFTFDTEADDEIQLNCLLGYYGLATGRALFDDIKLELLSTQDMNPQISLDAAKIGEPISKYVYGQFIEHLGRCIYGGIWAEMLDDRKFYWPVGKAPSPWTKVGRDGVEMDEETPFSGEHGVGLLSEDDRAGVAQGNLGLVAGMEYVGSIWLRVQSDVGPVRVSLSWGDGASNSVNVAIQTKSRTWKRFPFRFRAGASTDQGRLEIVSEGQLATIGAVSLMPADNVNGFRKDTLELLKKLDSPIYRWPGGNFVSAYDWRDGLGDRDRRPTRKNPAWQGIDSNDVGLHEFMDLCRLIKTEPLVVVNAGFGDAHSAMEEVEYVNGPANSEWGAKRAKNGQKEPWNVKWWGIGNEMYGDWQHGHMDLRYYVQKHNDFARYMRRVDPTIKLVGVGAAGPWTEGMLKNCADSLNLVSEHFYVQERPGVAAHVAQMPREVKRIAEAHRDYRSRLANLKGKDIRIALDEWNYWYGPHVYGELGTIYFLKDALGVAAGLHEMFRNSDLYFMANYAQTVNVIGAIKTTKTKAAFDTTGLVLQKYREVFGVRPLQLGGSAKPLDAMAALSVDGKTLTLGVVNPTGQEQALLLSLAGLTPKGGGVRWEMAGDPKAFDTPDKPDHVKWVRSAEPALGASVRLTPYSITLFVQPLG